MLKTIIFLTFIFLIYNFARKHRLTLPCIACEGSGMFADCSPGTGAGTHTCDRYKSIVGGIDNIKKDFGTAKDAVFDVVNKIELPLKQIKEAMAKLGSIKDLIKIELPSFGNISIPEIPAMDCAIDFTKIPSFDPCKDVIEPVISGAVNDINKFTSDTLAGINNIINDINKAIKIIPGAQPIPQINSGSIPPVRINCEIALSEALAKIGLTQTNLCRIFSDEVNKSIKVLNSAIAIIIEGIKTAIAGLQRLFKEAIEQLTNAMTWIMEELKNQLVQLNIFKDIVAPISTLIGNIKQVNIFDAMKAGLVSGISAIFPGARFVDIIIIGLVIFIVGGIFYAYIILSSVLSPIWNTFLGLWSTISISAGLMSGKSLDKVFDELELSE